MKQKLYILIPALLLFFCSMQAQDTTKLWSLEECIRYATEHNIDIQQKAQEQRNREIDLSTSKNSWLPNLNASVSQSFSYGRSTADDNRLVDMNSASTSGSLNLSMPIFDGLKIPNDIAARKLDLKAAIESLNKAKEDLAINVASYYVQVLYNQELAEVAQLQVDLSAEQVKKTDLLVNAGKVAVSQLYEMKAQLARDEASLVEANNNVNLSLLDLAQLLELERSGISLKIEVPVLDDVIGKYMSSILPPDAVYSNAISFKPQIKEQEYLLKSQQKALKIAQAGYYPTLSFGASYSTNYYHLSKSGTEYDNPSFSDQLDQNQQKMFGFTLSIPIFNRFQVRNSVRTARVAIQTRQLLMENTKKTLYKEIQQAYYNATASQEKFVSAEKSVDASRIAHEYAEESYTAGKSNVFEYNEAKTKYMQSLSEQAQAKYNYIFRAKILDFYNGTPIVL